MNDDLLNQGITALKAGRKAEARALLARLLQQDPRDEQAWLWLSGAVETDEERRRCLERALALNPGNQAARRGLARLSPGPLPQTTAQEKQGYWVMAGGIVMFGMACILLVALAVISEAWYIPKKGPLYDTPYVVVYGQQGDDLTGQMMEGLDQHGIPYTFKSTDDEKVKRKELLPRMKAADL